MKGVPFILVVPFLRILLSAVAQSRPFPFSPTGPPVPGLWEQLESEFSELCRRHSYAEQQLLREGGVWQTWPGLQAALGRWWCPLVPSWRENGMEQIMRECFWVGKRPMLIKNSRPLSLFFWIIVSIASSMLDCSNITRPCEILGLVQFNSWAFLLRNSALL